MGGAELSKKEKESVENSYHSRVRSAISQVALHFSSGTVHKRYWLVWMPWLEPIRPAHCGPAVYFSVLKTNNKFYLSYFGTRLFFVIFLGPCL
jgi:hypothetical protein